MHGIGSLHACKERGEWGISNSPWGGLPVSRRELELELARERQQRRESFGSCVGGGCDSSSAPRAFGVSASGSGCSLGWTREHFIRGPHAVLMICLQKRETQESWNKEGGCGTRRMYMAAARHWSELEGDKPMSITAMPITPCPPNSSNASGPPTAQQPPGYMHIPRQKQHTDAQVLPAPTQFEPPAPPGAIVPLSRH